MDGDSILIIELIVLLLIVFPQNETAFLWRDQLLAASGSARFGTLMVEERPASTSRRKVFRRHSRAVRGGAA
jgi:hypothetical protein